MSNAKKVTASSGNVFADLGFANPEEELLKAKLVREIRGIIKRRKLGKQTLCIESPRLSCIESNAGRRTRRRER